jgi:hypothetical protein
MAKKSKTIEVCVGVGVNQLTPEYVTVEIPQLTKKQLAEFELYDTAMSKDEAKDKLIEVLMSQVVDLSTMSKIELGDDVIAEIGKLKTIINE